MRTAKLVMWLHWQVTWVLFLDSSSQPLADHPPVPPTLQRKGGWVRRIPPPWGLRGPPAPAGAHVVSCSAQGKCHCHPEKTAASPCCHLGPGGHSPFSLKLLGGRTRQ